MLNSTRLLNIYGKDTAGEQLAATAERLQRLADAAINYFGVRPSAKVDVHFVSIFQFGHYDVVNGYPVIGLPYELAYTGSPRSIPACGPGFAFFYMHAFVPGIHRALQAGICLHILQQVEGVGGYPFLAKEPFLALRAAAAARDLQPSEIDLHGIDTQLAQSRHYGDRLRPYLLAAATYAAFLVDNYGVSRVRGLLLGAHKDEKQLNELLALEAPWKARISRESSGDLLTAAAVSQKPA